MNNLDDFYFSHLVMESIYVLIIAYGRKVAVNVFQLMKKLILTKSNIQHMPLYAIKKPLVAQKPGLMIIVLIQAP